jgi:4-amino-4-deoxy-L-arabinose transferase-like glycosyltransferase
MSAERGRRRETLVVALLATLPLLPFLPRAVSIDAPVFVAVAHQVLRAPADPFGFEMVWDPTSPEVARFNRNPPLLSYWLALWVGLFGERDWVMHAALLPLAPLAALAFLGIARRLVGAGLGPVALLVTSPAFLVLATTLMLDVGLLACMLGAVYALVRSRDAAGQADAARWQWLAGGLAAAAGMVKYVGFSTAPLLGAGALLLLARPLTALRRLLLPPLLVWGLWGAATAALYGSPHFLGSTDVVTDRSFAPDEFWNQLVSTPVYYGCALVFPILLWAVTLFRGRRGTELALLGLLLGTAGAWWVLPDGEPSRRHPLEAEEAVFAALGFAGAFLLWAAALRPQRWRADPVNGFLALWLAGFLVFSALLNWHVNAADALLAAPPLLLLLFRDPALRPGPRLVALCVALVLPLSLLLAAADAIQANFYREAAGLVAVEIGERPGARWSVGQWGLQHYLARVGFAPVEPPMYGRSDLAVGDWVATARNVSQMDVDVNMSRYELTRVWTWQERSWLPLRTTNPDAGAGFYSHHYGYVPFAWSRLPVEEIQLGRVVKVRRSAGPRAR